MFKTPEGVLDKYPAEIKSFSIDGQPGNINGDTITVYVKTGLNNLVATFKTTGSDVQISGVSQISGVTINDFSQPKTYTVISFNGSPRSYLVTVMSYGLTSFAINGFTGTIGANTIQVNGKWTSKTNVLAIFTAPNSTIKISGVPQVSGVTYNDFSIPIVYDVTAPNGSTASYAVTFTVTYPFADTGQTQCSSGVSANGAMATCPNASVGAVQDGDFANTPAARSFTGPTQHPTFTSDYITTDNVTGLTWKSCSEGQSGPACATGAGVTYTLSPDTATPNCTALNSANSGAGYSGRTNWRLPTAEELQTLVNYGLSSPSIDTNFPAGISGNYWTSSAYVPVATSGWQVNNQYGYLVNFSKTLTAYVRCVANSSAGYVPPLTDNGDGTVSDKTNNVVWQKCSRGQSNNASCSGAATTATWLTALSYCQALSLAGRSWRLPNVTELASISVKSTSNPAIQAAYFPGTVANYYWSSTTVMAGTTSAWYVDFNDGTPNNVVKTSSYYTRCVAMGP